MFKLIFPAFLCLAFACPLAAQAQDCGCAQPEPTCGCEQVDTCCQKTRKKLVLVDVQREVCRLERVCETDCCGCPQSKLKRVKKCVTRKKLALVDVPVDPCAPKLLGRLRGKLGSLGCGCKSDCGCDAPVADCGCGAPAADCGCGTPVYATGGDVAVPAEDVVEEAN